MQTCLSEEDKEKGYVSLCCAHPKEDVVIETHAFNDLYLSRHLAF